MSDSEIDTLLGELRALNTELKSRTGDIPLDLNAQMSEFIRILFGKDSGATFDNKITFLKSKNRADVITIDIGLMKSFLKGHIETTKKAAGVSLPAVNPGAPDVNLPPAVKPPNPVVASHPPVAQLGAKNDALRPPIISQPTTTVVAPPPAAPTGRFSDNAKLTLKLDNNIINSVAFNHDGTLVMSGGNNNIVTWNTSKGDVNKEFKLEANVEKVAFKHDGSKFVYILSDPTKHTDINIFDVESQNTITVKTGESKDKWAHSVAFNRKGTLIACGNVGFIAIYDFKTDKIINEIGRKLNESGGGYEASSVNSVAFNHDGTQLVSGSSSSSESSDKLIYIWNYNITTKEWDFLQTLDGDKYAVNSVAFNHDGTKIVSGCIDKSIKVWEKKTDGKWELSYKIEGIDDTRNSTGSDGHLWHVNSVAFNHDGTRIVSGGSLDNYVKIWDAVDGKLVQSLEIPLPDKKKGLKFNINSVAFNHDGTQIVSGDSIGTVTVWEIADTAAASSLPPTSATPSSVIEKTPVSYELPILQVTDIKEAMKMSGVNRCFLNSVMQMLYHIPEVRDKYHSITLNKGVNGNTMSDKNVTLMQIKIKNFKGALDILSSKTDIGPTSCTVTNNNGQEDVDEYLQLDCFPVLENDVELYKLFLHNEVRIESTWSECITHTNPSISVPISYQSKNIIDSIKDTQFSGTYNTKEGTDEKIPGTYKETGIDVKDTKYCIVLLKRFDDKKDKTEKDTPIQKNKSIILAEPDRLLTLDEVIKAENNCYTKGEKDKYIYKLRGFIYQRGEVKSGHYVYYWYNDTKWKLYDDSSMKDVSDINTELYGEVVAINHGYLYLYERVGV